MYGIRSEKAGIQLLFCHGYQMDFSSSKRRSDASNSSQDLALITSSRNRLLSSIP